jgi:pilus assembly protein CpaF
MIDERVLHQVKARLLSDRPDQPTAAVHDYVDSMFPLLPRAEAQRTAGALNDELFGLGLLAPLMADPSVDEILVNGGRDVWVERAGVLTLVDHLPPGRADVLLERILLPLGLRVDRTSPTVDARLPDGSRVSAVVAPLAVDGTCIAIRRFRRRRLVLADFTDASGVDLLDELVSRRCNVIVSGATSSGKTSLLNALVARVAGGERIVTIEDIAELDFGTDHVVRLECRPASVDGPQAVTVRDLLRAALRLRPDRIVVGEVRGAEAFDMVQALDTGHDGSLSTCHANGSDDALRRIEAMAMQSGVDLPLVALREQVHSSFDAIVHVERARDGHRWVREIAEVTREVGPPRTVVRWRDGRRLGRLERAR